MHIFQCCGGDDDSNERAMRKYLTYERIKVVFYGRQELHPTSKHSPSTQTNLHRFLYVTTRNGFSYFYGLLYVPHTHTCELETYKQRITQHSFIIFNTF